VRVYAFPGARVSLLRLKPVNGRRFRATSLEFDEDAICVCRTRVLAYMRLGRTPDDFVRRFFDVDSAVSESQPPPEITEGDENTIGVVVRLGSVARSIHISQYAHAVVFEENLIQLRIGHCGISFHFASLLRFTTRKVSFRYYREPGRFDDSQTLSGSALGTAASRTSKLGPRVRSRAAIRASRLRSILPAAANLRDATKASVMLYVVPIWGIAVALIVWIAICGELGFQLGGRIKASLGESPFGILQAAFFGLLALLLAFSFSLGLSRYDARRIEVEREANSIATTFLRTQLLDAKTALLMRRDLRQYVDARIAFASAGVHDWIRADAVRRSDALQREMWGLAMTQSSSDKHSTMVPLFIAALNDTIDESGEEEDVLAAHIPDPVVIVLSIVIGFASILLGIGFGRTDHRGGFAIGFFAITLALVVAMILDLDHPQRGFIRVSLEPLQSLRQTLVDPSPPGAYR
jgi:hypothetical protein